MIRQKIFFFILLFVMIGMVACSSAIPMGVNPNQNEAATAETEVSSTASESGAHELANRDDVILIGVLATLEGVFETLGEDSMRGVEIAIDEFGGEIAGKRIEIVTASTDTSAELALEQVTYLVEELQVDFVVGPVSGDEGLAVKSFAKENLETTFLNGTAGAQDITLRDPAPNYFRFSTDGTQWMAGLGTYVYEEQGHQNIVTIGEDYSFPYSQVGGFLTEYCRVGGQVDSQFWTPLGTNDYSSVISAIPADIDAIYVALGGTDAVNFLRQYQRFGGTAPLIAGSVTLDQTILGAEKISEYVLGTASAGPIADDNTDPAWQEFATTYRSAFPDGLGSPSLFAHGYYVNTKAALLALEEIDGDLSGGQQRFQETLRNLSFDSPTGPIELDHNQNAITTIFLTEVTQDESGNLFNKLVKTTPNVNQTLGIPENEFLNLGPFYNSHAGCGFYLAN